MTQDSRIDRLEVSVEHIATEVQTLRSEMNSLRGEMNSRMNVLTQIAFGNVAVTILTAVGIVAAVILTS